MLRDIDPPPAEPVSLDETRRFLRLEHDEDDGRVAQCVQAARERLEDYLGVAMIRRALRLEVAARACVHLPRWPVASVDAVQADGADAAEYHVDLRRRPSVVSVRAEESVTVDFTAGYGTDPGDVPAPLRQAVLLLAAHYFDAGGEVPEHLPLMVDALSLPYKGVSL